MSRAGAVEDRAPLDLYETPAPLAAAICSRLRGFGIDPVNVIEPSAGPGAFVRAARKEWPDARVHALDLDADHGPACIIAGASTFRRTDWVEWTRTADRFPGETLILGNPPYRDARAHIEAGLRYLAPGEHLAFLLRLNFLGSRTRLDLWNQPGLHSVSTCVPRPSFTGNGRTDGTEYALFVWRKGWDGWPWIPAPLTWEAP